MMLGTAVSVQISLHLYTVNVISFFAIPTSYRQYRMKPRSQPSSSRKSSAKPASVQRDSAKRASAPSPERRASASLRSTLPRGTSPAAVKRKAYAEKLAGASSAAGRTSSRGTASRAVSKPRSKSTVNFADDDGMLRLNKFLADAGVGSRRKADELIAEGKVKVNGRVVTELGTRVHLSDLVTVGGEPVNAEKHLTYILLNKPKDYITTTNDEKGRKTVMDLLSGRLEERIYPIGRLDRHTTGVLLLTNDGEMAHRLMHPRYQIPRVYSVFLDKRLATQDAKRVAEGVEISVEDGEDYVSAPCELLIDPQDAKHATLAIAEGKNREVRRIFEALGYEVARLDRKSYAGLTTRGLARGEYRHLSREEVRALESAVGLENRFNTGVADTKSAHNVRGIKSSRSTKSSRSIKSSRGIKSTNAHTTPARSTSRSNTARKRR